MSLSGIGQSGNPPKYRVPNHRTIAQKPCCNHRCLPIRLKMMQADIDEPSMLLKNLVKFISPTGPSVSLLYTLSTQDQQGVHSPSVCALVVVRWQVVIRTTSISSNTLQSVSSGAPHHVELLGLQFRYHASNSSLRNSVHPHHAVPLQYHPLDLQAHLTTATESNATSHRDNGISVWL